MHLQAFLWCNIPFFSSGGRQLLQEEDEWGSWNDDRRGNNDDDDDDALESWLNDDKSSNNRDHNDTNDGWGDWGEVGGDDKKSLKSSQNMKRKERLKTSKNPEEDSWTEDWGLEKKEKKSSTKSSSSKKGNEAKDPLVGNLLDLDINDVGETGTSNWDNEVWADGDDEDWQALELDSKHKWGTYRAIGNFLCGTIFLKNVVI